MRNGVLREKLFRLDAGGLEDRAPLRELGADEGVEFLGARADELESLRREPRLHPGVLRDLRHFAVQAVDDRPPPAPGAGEALPPPDPQTPRAPFPRRPLGQARARGAAPRG